MKRILLLVFTNFAVLAVLSISMQLLGIDRMLTQMRQAGLLDQVAAGEEVILAKAGVPVARIVPVVRPPGERELGTERGRVFIADDFDAPLPGDLLDSFEA